MAFVERDDILRTIDGLVTHVMRKVRGIDIQTPLPRYTYADVMERFGSDKPDLRFGMELIDIGEVAAAMSSQCSQCDCPGGRVRGINVKGCSEKYSRRLLDVDLKNLSANSVQGSGLHEGRRHEARIHHRQVFQR